MSVKSPDIHVYVSSNKINAFFFIIECWFIVVTRYCYASMQFFHCLQNDKRFLILDCVPEERRKILISHVEELEQKGPPPPPTASAPSHRGMK